MSATNRLAHLRRRARNVGLAIRKDRARSINLDHLGGYCVVDPNRNWIVAGGRYELDLDDVEQVIAGQESR